MNSRRISRVIDFIRLVEDLADPNGARLIPAIKAPIINGFISGFISFINTQYGRRAIRPKSQPNLIGDDQKDFDRLSQLIESNKILLTTSQDKKCLYSLWGIEVEVHFLSYIHLFLVSFIIASVLISFNSNLLLFHVQCQPVQRWCNESCIKPRKLPREWKRLPLRQ